VGPTAVLDAMVKRKIPSPRRESKLLRGVVNFIFILHIRIYMHSAWGIVESQKFTCFFQHPAEGTLVPFLSFLSTQRLINVKCRKVSENQTTTFSGF
jgi:hypothetical protein